MAKHATYRVQRDRRISDSELARLADAGYVRIDGELVWTLKPPSKWPIWARTIWKVV